MYRSPVLQLYRDRLIRELHQEPVGASECRGCKSMRLRERSLWSAGGRVEAGLYGDRTYLTSFILAGV
jgi:hypothetical protein